MKFQLHGEMNLLASVVHNVKVFVDAILNRTFNRQSDRIGLNITILCAECRIGEIKARSIKAKLSGIDQYPGISIDEKTVGVDKTSIYGVNTLVAILIDRPTL